MPIEPSRRKRLLRIAKLRRLVAQHAGEPSSEGSHPRLFRRIHLSSAGEVSLQEQVEQLEAEVKADLIALNKKRQRLTELKQVDLHSVCV